MKLDEFPYAWRYTDENYALFSEKELSELTILPELRANLLWDRMVHVPVFYESAYIKEIVNRNIPVFISDCGWGNEQQEAVTRKQLADFLYHCETSVILFYSRAYALEMPAELFLNRWSDFCYPDDANIILAGTDFLIYYEDVIYGACALPKEEPYG